MGRVKRVRKSRQVPKTRTVAGPEGPIIESYFETETYYDTEYVSTYESYSSSDAGSYSGGE